MRPGHFGPLPDEFAINPVAADAGMRVKKDSVTKALGLVGAGSAYENGKER